MYLVNNDDVKNRQKQCQSVFIYMVRFKGEPIFKRQWCHYSTAVVLYKHLLHNAKLKLNKSLSIMSFQFDYIDG